jgi:vacuolar-type H+-ATPase subunit C/Vma6
MALYDYGNTRLRARISRLLSIQTLESYSDLTSIDSFISALTKTPYKESIEAALTYAHGYGCVAEAMQRELKKIVTDLNRFYEGNALENVSVIFRRMDLLNIKAILRGLSHEAHIEDVTSSFSPLGTIPNPILLQIAKSKDVYEAISRIVVYQLPVAKPLMELKARSMKLTSSEIELALEKWYFDQINIDLNGNSEDIRILREYYAIEADIVNLNTVLRFVGAPEAYSKIENGIESFLINPGNITTHKLIMLSRMQDVTKVIEALFFTKYGKFLRIALQCYQESQLLSEFENQMRMYALDWLSVLPKQYPLGIGVPLGYASMKKSEIRNLRWIAKGIQSGFEPGYIKENLEKPHE